MPKPFKIATTQQLTEYVRALRKSRGQTQTDVARILGVSAMRVATIEKDVGRLSTGRLLALLQVLGAHLELKTDGNPAHQPDTPRVTPAGEW
jgi:transcriptional regulator with XRE-family HTH domain